MSLERIDRYYQVYRPLVFVLLLMRPTQGPSTVGVIHAEDTTATRRSSIGHVGSLGARKVGSSCNFNKECVPSAFCENDHCRCWSSHVTIDDYCWRKVNPEESGCTYDEQCEAVWPGSHCNSAGVCKCPREQTVSITREGPVCHLPAECPTNGAHPILYTRNSNRAAECYFLAKNGQEIPGNFIGCDDFADVYDCIGGLCCPTRALTCIQPKDAGHLRNGSKPAQRWYYNSVKGLCLKFEYMGFGGNANNFLTEDHCKSYCTGRCPRGQPLLEEKLVSKETHSANELVLSCSSSSDCHSNKYQCQKVQTHHSVCCPSPDYVCSEYGGIGGGHDIDFTKRPTISAFSTGTSRFGREPATRWYWDRLLRKCKTFRYHGQGGNFNSFINEEECLKFCSMSLCPVGSPLRLESGGNAECTADSQCPRSHYCTATVCCPTATTVCNQPQAAGKACNLEPVIRYWFNSAAGKCESFQFNGCGGNANNFATTSDCQQFCSMVEDKLRVQATNIISLLQEPKCEHGEPIRLDNGRYWKCNSSSTSEESTDEQCPVNYECHYDGRVSACCPSKAYTCKISPDAGRSCSGGSAVRWYFDAALRACKTFEYNGCDGNSNNFNSKKECEEYCGVSGCPYGGNVLRSESDSEPVECGPNIDDKCPSAYQCTRLSNSEFAKNRPWATHFCCPTRFTICNETIQEGNANNFETHQACQHFCSAAACAAGEMIYRSRADEEPMDCSKEHCPSGFVCVSDMTNPERSVCCGTLNMGVCPNGQGVFVDERSQKPMTCSAERPTDCPYGYFCVFNSQRNKFYCCAPNNYKNLKCPNGLETTENIVTGDIMGCNVDSQCPPGSKCQKSGHQSGLCCLSGPACPPTYQLDVAHSRKECSPLKQSSCSADRSTVCLFSDVLERFVCCRRGARPPTELTECPGQMVRDPRRRFCSTTELCPPTYNCIRRNYDRVGICCRHRRTPAIVNTLECPKGGTPYIDTNGFPFICSERIPCPAPYKCRLSHSPGSKTRMCCMDNAILDAHCPNDLLPLSTDGRVQTCTSTACPAGYSCMDDACCPNEDFACTVPFYAGIACSFAKPKQRWYFHASTARCQPFLYQGCTPSANNFPDEDTCHRLCLSETLKKRNQCPHPYKNTERIPPQICSPAMDACPDGEKCVATISGQFVCCLNPSSSPKEVEVEPIEAICPDGYQPALSEDLGAPNIRQCDAESRPCYDNQICHHNDQAQAAICCQQLQPQEEPQAEHIPQSQTILQN